MSQLIQNKYEKETFFDFLNKYCDKDKENLIFNKSALKRAKIDNAIDSFRADLKNHYFLD